MYAEAIAELDDVSTRSGPVYLFARGSISAAAVDSARTTLDWAVALAGQGHVDQALEMAGRITEPTVVGDAAQTAARIALDDARRQASTGHSDVALARLDEVAAGRPAADVAAAAAALRPGYAVAAAGVLVREGEPRRAVAALDGAVAAGLPDALAQKATALYPGALLAAGQSALAAQDEVDALSFLNRLVGRFPATNAARAARALLAADQSVTGTLVHRDGSPAPAFRVRLGSNFRREGTGFITSPPYFYTGTDLQGAFTFQGIPVGSHLTLEILDNGQWTVLETTDPTTGDERPVYQVDVSPLTPVDLAFVRLP